MCAKTGRRCRYTGSEACRRIECPFQMTGEDLLEGTVAGDAEQPMSTCRHGPLKGATSFYSAFLASEGLSEG